MNNQGLTEEETRDRVKWRRLWVLENGSGEASNEWKNRGQKNSVLWKICGICQCQLDAKLGERKKSIEKGVLEVSVTR